MIEQENSPKDAPTRVSGERERLPPLTGADRRWPSRLLPRSSGSGNHFRHISGPGIPFIPRSTSLDTSLYPCFRSEAIPVTCSMHDRAGYKFVQSTFLSFSSSFPGPSLHWCKQKFLWFQVVRSPPRLAPWPLHLFRQG